MSSLLLPPKMLKGKKAKGKRWRQPLPSWRSRRPRRWWIPFLKKGLRILSSDKTSSPKRTSPILSSGPATFSCRGNGLFSISVWKCLLPLTSSPRPWVNKQLCSPNNYAATQAGPQVLIKDKAREEAEIAGPGWRKKMPAKGMSPQKGHLTFEQELTLSPPWWRTRRPS